MNTTTAAVASSLKRHPQTIATSLPRAEASLQLQWVASEARRMARRLPSSVQADDLVGAGCLGLMSALERFDASRGMSLEGFARMKIRAAMLDELRELDVLPRRSRSALNRLSALERQFTADNGRGPSAEELAGVAGVSVARVRELQALADRARESAPLDDDNAPSSLSTPEEPLQQRQEAAALAEAVARLPKRHQEVLAGYYQGDLTFKELGARLGVTESRICQIHKEALKMLRERV